MTNEQTSAIHWADQLANNIIRDKGDKNLYTVASGITPSGVVHFGNFREVMTVDLVYRALKQMGKNVRFIYSWDDYDTFRKVPANLPKQEELNKFLYQPIVDVPDPYDEHKSYALHFEKNFEKYLPAVGINYVDFIYQNTKYRDGDYNEQVKIAMDRRNDIVEILQSFKSSKIEDNWFPLLTYCQNCNRDRIDWLSYDSTTANYKCKLCEHEGSENLNDSHRLKLPWRIDWPMRWALENVDFEPGGRDHSSAGGSRETGAIIIDKIYGKTAPVYSEYEFIGIKGFNGKISSSKGNVITLADVLNVYEPEIIRWLFASYKPTAAFDLAFDLDVLKNYEEFDRLERIVYKIDYAPDDKYEIYKRVYELSQINSDGIIPETIPFQAPFRHLCNILQINNFDIEGTKKFFADDIKNEKDNARFETRAKCAAFWIQNHAPEDFRFMLNQKKREDVELSVSERKFIKQLKNELAANWNMFGTDKYLQNKIADLMTENNLDAKFYGKLYQLLISRDKGPKLAGFIMTVGRDNILPLL